MQNNVETEIKLLIAKKYVKALTASSLIAKKTKKGSHKTVKLVNIYFDTRDLLLRQAGIAYRVRQNGKKFEATVKLGRSEAGGLSARQEYNVAVKNAKPDLSVFSDSGLQVDFDALLGTAQVEKLFTVRVKREIRLLQVTKETVVEMAIDQGFISAGGKKETIDEVELELKEGSLADLLAYTAKIAAEVPVFTESRSKYARGLTLLDKLEPEGTSPLLELDWEKDYCEEYKKQFYQYGTAVMEEQNVFADCGKLQTEADRIFLPYFERMQEALYWLQPVMDGSAGMQANLQGALRPLYRLRDTKALLRRWQSLFKLADGRLGADKVTRLLENRVEDIGDEIQMQVERGTYSGIVFSLWAAMESAAPARRSGAHSWAPCSSFTPLMIATLPSTVMLVPIRFSSSTYLKRFSKIVSVTVLPPFAVLRMTVICGCISVGKPGYGRVLIRVRFSSPDAVTRTASSYSVTVQPISRSFELMHSRCFGITFLTRMSPRVAAAAAIKVPASIWSGITV